MEESDLRGRCSRIGALKTLRWGKWVVAPTGGCPAHMQLLSRQNIDMQPLTSNSFTKTGDDVVNGDTSTKQAVFVLTQLHKG